MNEQWTRATFERNLFANSSALQPNPYRYFPPSHELRWKATWSFTEFAIIWRMQWIQTENFFPIFLFLFLLWQITNFRIKSVREQQCRCCIMNTCVFVRYLQLNSVSHVCMYIFTGFSAVGHKGTQGDKTNNASKWKVHLLPIRSLLAHSFVLFLGICLAFSGPTTICPKLKEMNVPRKQKRKKNNPCTFLCVTLVSSTHSSYSLPFKDSLVLWFILIQVHRNKCGFVQIHYFLFLLFHFCKSIL